MINLFYKNSQMLNSPLPISSPNKPMRLFQMFSDEPANTPCSNYSSKTQSTQAFERSSTSP